MRKFTVVALAAALVLTHLPTTRTITTANAGTSGFHVEASIVARYAELEGRLNQSLRGNKYRYGRRTFRVRGIGVYGESGRAVVRVDVAGALKGRLFLAGSPAYDVDSGDLTIPDLDYSLETQNLLAKVGDWFNHDEWRDALRARTRWNLRDQAAAQMQALTSSLYGDHGPVTVSGRVEAPQVLEIAAKPDGIYTRLVVDGEIGFAFRRAAAPAAAPTAVGP